MAELNQPRSEIDVSSTFEGLSLVSSDASTERFVNAAVSARSVMTDEQLHQHVAELAEALAMHHEREKLELSSAWTAMMPEWSRRSQEKAAFGKQSDHVRIEVLKVDTGKDGSVYKQDQIRYISHLFEYN